MYVLVSVPVSVAVSAPISTTVVPLLLLYIPLPFVFLRLYLVLFFASLKIAQSPIPVGFALATCVLIGSQFSGASLKYSLSLLSHSLPIPILLTLYTVLEYIDNIFFFLARCVPSLRQS